MSENEPILYFFVTCAVIKTEEDENDSKKITNNLYIKSTSINYEDIGLSKSTKLLFKDIISAMNGEETHKELLNKIIKYTEKSFGIDTNFFIPFENFSIKNKMKILNIKDHFYRTIWDGVHNGY
jgi:hypothetical protein